jgi:hypothetical protein
MSANSVYNILVKDSVDFSDAPKAEIACYKWTEGYTPYAFAQLIYVRDLGLALHMEAYESDPKSVYTMYNQPVYTDSCLEFFVNCNPDQPLYINFEMNANGAFLSALRPGRKGKQPIHELMSDLPAVMAKKFEDHWSVDAFFTLSQIKTLFGKDTFETGDVLLGNFYKCGDETPIPHFGMWAPIDLEAPDFHRPEFFGKLIIGAV